MANQRTQFTALMRILHWTMAAMILTMLAVGVTMVASLAHYHILVSIHRPLGVAVLILAVVRFVVRRASRLPPFPPTMSRLERRAASAGEYAMYGLMLALPLVGWAMLSAARYPIVLLGSVHLPFIVPESAALYATLRTAHTILAGLLFLAVLGHVGAVLFHTLIVRDGMLFRMAPGAPNAGFPIPRPRAATLTPPSRFFEPKEVGVTMANVTYEAGITGLLVIDPYNDFISEGGKLWDRTKSVAEKNGCILHMAEVLDAARKANVRVFYALHRRYRPGDYDSWTHIAPIQESALKSKVFENGSWGGEIRREFEPKPGDLVAQEHWCSSGFANTDLDLLLKAHGIHKLIVIGLRVNTCLEATVRFAAELGYEVTVVKDATAGFSEEEMHVVLDVNIPNYASAIVTTNEVVASILACSGAPPKTRAPTPRAA